MTAAPTEPDRCSKVNTVIPVPLSYPTQPGAPWKMLLLVFSSLIALVACYLAMQPPELHSDWSIEVSVVSLITLGGFFVFSLLLFRTPYLFTSAYMLALSLFHLGITIPESFGFMEVEGWHSGAFVKWLEQAGWYTVLALACIGVGFSLSVTPSRLARLHRQVEPFLVPFRMIY